MQVVGRWIGEPVAHEDVQIGDLVVVQHGENSFLALNVQARSVNYGLVLRELSGPSGATVPGLTLFDDLALSHHTKIRRLTGTFSAEPVSANATEILPVGTTSPIPNGSLAVFVGGEFGIYVREGRDVEVFDLLTGLVRQRTDVGFFQAPWRLVWRDGDESRELASFAAAPTE